MVKRRSKKSVARKVKRRISGKKAVPRKMKRGYNIHPGKPTGREVQAMHRLQVLTGASIRSLKRERETPSTTLRSIFTATNII